MELNYKIIDHDIYGKSIICDDGVTSIMLIQSNIEMMFIPENTLQFIEKVGRVCYKSEDKITEDSAYGFVDRLVKRNHLAMIEHCSMSYKIICDRIVTHELVRHRLFSFAQESTRYVSYLKNVPTFIIPDWFNISPELFVCSEFDDWIKSIFQSVLTYNKLILDYKWAPEQARTVLAHSLKTEIVVTGNLREWLHFFNLRTKPNAYSQIRRVANMILDDCKTYIPVVFDDI